ncbi:uncharacterized protein K441DRAFT_721537 [Cenococcum geophilum 1.58]|uniref:uncharacterized protein n=1 Tax=Cenococcum geophilum 1.58 TaxID=794803 RepID=UPI00358FEF86|nr:hypothetical protein K441DRAFT_721537 [Cenococcum geophilum 1.58]
MAAEQTRPLATQSSIARFLPNHSATPLSDDVILAPEYINSTAKGRPEVEEFKYSGRQYIRCKSLTLGVKNTKPRTSPIWKWGEDVQLKGEVGDRKKMNRYTGFLKPPKPSDSNQPTIEDYPEQRVLKQRSNFEAFKQLLIRWIVCCYIAFFQFKNKYFRSLLYYLYPALPKFLLKAGKTIRGWVMAEFKRKKDNLKKELASAHSSISVSFDL